MFVFAGLGRSYVETRSHTGYGYILPFLSSPEATHFFPSVVLLYVVILKSQGLPQNPKSWTLSLAFGIWPMGGVSPLHLMVAQWSMVASL